MGKQYHNEKPLRREKQGNQKQKASRIQDRGTYERISSFIRFCKKNSIQALMFLYRRGAVLSDSSSFCVINGLNQDNTR